MSLIGIRIYLNDSATALSAKLRVLLYRTSLPCNSLPIEVIKNNVPRLIKSTEIWWAAKPYVKLVIDKELEKEMIRNFKFTKITATNSDGKWFLVDICDITREPTTRYMRAVDLDCSVEGVFVIENNFDQGMVVTSS